MMRPLEGSLSMKLRASDSRPRGKSFRERLGLTDGIGTEVDMGAATNITGGPLAGTTGHRALDSTKMSRCGDCGGGGGHGGGGLNGGDEGESFTDGEGGVNHPAAPGAVSTVGGALSGSGTSL
mmetsp:Transcript_129308/g.275822  ORF Transcript_129308/g.275822 Transcript_129308/m.275822 type:complete len:123 (+) Transcript_129308:1504-1872(+)